MKILIYGAGAVGSTFGGFLSKTHEVTLLGRAVHLNAIRRDGLHVSGIWGSHHFTRFKLETHFSLLARKKIDFDLILVTVKSYDTPKAARDIAKILKPGTLIMSLQNGLGNIEALHRALPKKQVLAGRIIFGAAIPSPGHVKITVIADPNAIGETETKKMTPRIKQFSKIFSDAGCPSVPCADVQSLLWGKVIYNSALNPLASLLECRYGFLMEMQPTRLVMGEVIEEIYDVAKKAGIRLNPATAAQYEKLFYAKLVPRTYDHRPSMLQDLEKGKRTEIDSINGAVVDIGKKFGVKTPVNRMLVRLIKQKESL